MYPTNPPLWERVSPAQLRQELAALAAEAAESAGILQTLSREDSREALRELAAAQARTARCLGGLLFLSDGRPWRHATGAVWNTTGNSPPAPATASTVRYSPSWQIGKPNVCAPFWNCSERSRVPPVPAKGG